MKKIIALLVTLTTIFTFFTPAVSAADPLGPACNNAPDTQFCRNENTEDNRTLVHGPDSLMMRIARTIILATGSVSVIMIVIGGFKYVVSNGDSNGIQSAKNTILYAIVGLVVAVFAQVIVTFVLSRFL